MGQAVEIKQTTGVLPAKSKLSHGLLKRVLPQPLAARHAEYSMLFSADDGPGKPSPALLSLSLQAAGVAKDLSLSWISERMEGPPYYPEIWPGESYKLLAALVQILKPKLVIEIGTGGGLSALAMLRQLPPGGRIVTWDIESWKDMPGAVLRKEDFRGPDLVQHTDDITHPEGFSKYTELFAQADFFHIDAAKDGVMEQRLLDLFEAVPFRNKPLFVFDDIRLWAMLKIWRGIQRPKLDVTSFGHWTGTGLVEWL